MIIGHPLKTKNLELPEVLKLNNSDIKRVNKTKSLGVIVDEKLNWDDKFKRTKGKVSGGLAALKKLKNIVPQSQLCNVYYTLMGSHLRYADVIWSSLSKTKLAGLQRLQDRACSIISNAKIKDNWSSSWLNVENLFRYDGSVMTYKIVNRLCPESLWNKYHPRSSHSTYNTRHCKDLQIPKYRTEFAKKGFNFAALKLWNDTLAKIRELPALDRFKKQLKTHLKS